MLRGMDSPRAQSDATRAVVVPGNHDGVHVGHAALLAMARREAERDGARVVALTFDPHPLALLAPERAPSTLTHITRRAELLLQAGADEVVIAPFDARFARLTATEFTAHELAEKLHASAIIIGPDFRFGQGRAGDIALLREEGARLGFRVVVAETIPAADVTRVSSTSVREALVRGDVSTAARMLGRVHELDGEVIHGQAKGRTIGFPTANLAPSSVLLPKDGVYAVVCRVLGEEGALLTGVANLGVRPTLGAGRSVEVHLFDTQRDLYGKTLRVGFVERLRDEQKFDGLSALVAQIDVDAKRARELASAYAEAAPGALR